MKFNVVGLAGVVVQLGAFAALVRWLDAPIALATVAAVEAAVLHNFVLHQRWTWRDRPSSGMKETARRLLRFQTANGLVSLVGNVAITVALARAGLNVRVLTGGTLAWKGAGFPTSREP